MVTVGTLHGIWSGQPGYSATFFETLRREGLRTCQVEGAWPGAWLGPLALVALAIPRYRRRVESALAQLVARTEPASDLVLVSHSLGCEITRGFLVRTGLRPRLWVTAGTFGALLGVGWGHHLPLVARVALILASTRTPTGLPHVPWVNVYYQDDTLGQALAPLGVSCRDVTLPVPTPFLAGHQRYWGDPSFARVVAHELRGSS